MADFLEEKGEGNLLIFMNILWKFEIYIDIFILLFRDFLKTVLQYFNFAKYGVT